MTSKMMREVLITKTKSLKRVLRFGNLETSLRPKLWVKLIKRNELEHKIANDLNLEN